MTECQEEGISKNIPADIHCPSIIGNYGQDGCWYPELTPPPTPTTESVANFPFPINRTTTTAAELPASPESTPEPTPESSPAPVHTPSISLEYAALPPPPVGVPFPSNYYIITPPPTPFVPQGYNMQGCFLPPLAPMGFFPSVHTWPGCSMSYVPPPCAMDPVHYEPLPYDPNIMSEYSTLSFTENTEVYDLYGSFKGTKLPTSRPILLTAKPSKYSAGIEAVWKKHFQIIAQAFPDAWLLDKTEEPLTSWQLFSDSAKVRFCCKNCNHGWTSMHGSVLFYYRREHYGEVRYRLTGQKCDDCDDTSFQSPAWYPEEAQKVMNNLGNEIASRLYGIPTEPKSKDRRYGRPSKQHNSSGCESCHLGICHVGRKTNPTSEDGDSNVESTEIEDICDALADVNLSSNTDDASS